ncbi:MAG TPA: hypothetical protein VGX23_37840 [Actinocrinis sp.]|nr:hypothetical protein [Actinocrinis sp.]
MVPLIQRLCNEQFVQNLDDLDMMIAKSTNRKTATSDNDDTRRCKCGCDAPVAEGRKFINQSHYGTWLSQERFFGKNRRT